MPSLCAYKGCMRSSILSYADELQFTETLNCRGIGLSYCVRETKLCVLRQCVVYAGDRQHSVVH